MKINNVIATLVSSILMLTSCSKDEVSSPSSNAAFDVTYSTELQNTIYPSMIFGLTEIEKLQGEPIEYFSIAVNTQAKINIRIVIEESKLNYETIITEQNVIGERQIIPSLKWKYDDLKNLSQPGNVDLTFVCYNNDDEEIGRKNLKMSYRAINECVLAAQIDEEAIPFYFFAAAYVNEDSPVIDKFLQDVLQYTELSGFVGYQQGSDMVIAQVAAAFNTLRGKGVKYSSITGTSNSNPNVLSQYIRFSDEVLNNTQANCADGTTFFCSVLKKIGIHSVMIFVPGHVYVGYYEDDDKTSLRLLETTAVGSDLSFEDASDYQIDAFNANVDNFINDDYFDGYFLIDVDDTRQIIKPIGR